MALLSGDIATLFADVFGDIYLPGTITTVTRANDPASPGNLVETTSQTSCRVQVDACTERQQLEQGYSSKDVRLLILQTVPVRNGDRVTVKSKTWTVGPTITEDPASSHWECRGVPI